MLLYGRRWSKGGEEVIARSPRGLELRHVRQLLPIVNPYDEAVIGIHDEVEQDGKGLRR